MCAAGDGGRGRLGGLCATLSGRGGGGGRQGGALFWAVCDKEGPYQDRPPLCPFRLLPLLIYSGSVIAFLKFQRVQIPKI